MTVDRWTGREILVAPDVLGITLFLVLPVAVIAVDTSFATPLALPGYLVLTVGSWYGSHLFPTYALRVFWIPFVGSSYVGALVVGVAWRFALRRYRRQ